MLDILFIYRKSNNIKKKGLIWKLLKIIGNVKRKREGYKTGYTYSLRGIILEHS